MTYYEILHVPENATTQEIVSSFRKLAKEFHPDRNKSPEAAEKFVLIYEAYKVLSDENKRRLYDQSIKNNEQNNLNKEYEDFVKNAKQEGNNFAKEKYRKAIYKIFSSVKKGFIQTIVFCPK